MKNFNQQGNADCKCVYCRSLVRLCVSVSYSVVSSSFWLNGLFMEFSRQEYWIGLPFHSPEHLPDTGIKPRSSALKADSLPSEQAEGILKILIHVCSRFEGWKWIGNSGLSWVAGRINPSIAYFQSFLDGTNGQEPTCRCSLDVRDMG